MVMRTMFRVHTTGNVEGFPVNAAFTCPYWKTIDYLKERIVCHTDGAVERADFWIEVEYEGEWWHAPNWTYLWDAFPDGFTGARARIMTRE